MPRITIFVGVILIILGAVGWFASGGESVTAWIPAFFGTPLGLVGLLASNPARRKLFMHVAVTIGLIGAVGAGKQGLPNLGALFSGEAANPLATSMQCLMFAVCVIYVVLCVRSFIAARKNSAGSAS